MLPICSSLNATLVPMLIPFAACLTQLLNKSTKKPLGETRSPPVCQLPGSSGWLPIEASMNRGFLIWVKDMMLPVGLGLLANYS